MALMKKTLRDFALWTSASGIPHVGRAHNPCMRWFWLLIFLVCMACFAYQMVCLIQLYLNFDVLVGTELKFEAMAFPAVTICNLNPYKTTQVQKKSDLQKLLDNYIMASNKTLNTSNDWFNLLSVNDTMAQQSRARDILTYLVNDYNQTDRDFISYPMTDLLQTCVFNQDKCSIDDKWFQPKYDPTYGKCFTFNTTETSQRAGPRYGLRLFIKTNLSEYLDTTESAGVRLTITNKQEPIYPDAFGYNAQAGYTTSYALRFVRTTRLPAPYSDCNNVPIAEYSSEQCFRTCLQKHIASVCGCQDPHFDLVTAGNATMSSFCKYDKLECVNQATRSGNKETFEAAECSCPPLCDEGVYTVTTTSSNWPSQTYQKILCDHPTGSIDCHDYRENTMFIEIYFEALNYEVLTESQAYSLPSLISDFGGQIGLWIGVSVITFIEFLLLPCLMISSVINSKKIGPGTYREHEYDKYDNEFDRIGGGVWRRNDDEHMIVKGHYPFMKKMNPYTTSIEYLEPPTIQH